MNISRGKITSAQKVVIYGTEGIGKSTLASQFPNPIFIDTEGSTKNMDVARTPKPSSWTMLMDQIQYFKLHPNELSTLVIDTADWAEHLCAEHICSKSQKNGIEDFGYGKGYTYLEEEFGRFLNRLEEVIEVGVNVVITAHAQMRKFEQPDELGAYDRWELKLEKKTAPLLKEWADTVLFANYKTYVVNVDGQGVQKGKNKGQGNKRVMYTTHHSCWDAKNRWGAADELPFEYSAIAQFVPSGSNTTVQQAGTVKEEKAQPPIQQEHTNSTGGGGSTPPADTKQETTVKKEESNLPRNVLDLMQAKNITEKDIMDVAANKGYFPADTPLINCGKDFIDGWVIPYFDKICQMSREIKLARGEFVPAEPQEMPFNN